MPRTRLPLVLLCDFAAAFTIAVAGIHSGLGRELAVQGIERGFDVIGLVRAGETRELRHPFRQGWLSYDPILDAELPVVRDARLSFAPLGSKCTYDALLSCMGGSPFVEDTSHVVLAHILDAIPTSCKSVQVVSAYGVDENEQSNLGIRVMANWYLKSVYDSKRAQEQLVANSGLPFAIERPRALSYGPIPFNTISTPRQVLAKRMLDRIDAGGGKATL